MKKFLIALLSVVFCVALSVGLAACGDGTTNADGTPKNMAETIIDFDKQTSTLFCWADEGTKAFSGIRCGSSSQVLGNGTDYNSYGGFAFAWKKGSKYKITKLEFDITSQTPSTITVDCNFGEQTAKGGKGEYKHLGETNITSGQTVHVVFDNLNVEYSRFPQHVMFKDDGSTTDKSVLNWQIKISNLFITAEKV